MTSLSAQAPSAPSAPRKWDAEITTARQQPAWLAFEAGIHQKATRGGPCGTHRQQLAQLGFHWNRERQAWQHPCGNFRLSSSQDPHERYQSYFPARIRKSNPAAAVAA